MIPSRILNIFSVLLVCWHEGYSAASEIVLREPSIEKLSRTENSTENESLNIAQTLTCIPSILSKYICPNVDALSTLAEDGPEHSTRVRGLRVEWVEGALPLPAPLTDRLITLDLRGSGVTSLLMHSSNAAHDKQAGGLPFLQVLDLSNNPEFNLSSLAVLGPLDQLLRLDLSGLASVSVEVLQLLIHKTPRLQTLNLSNCSLTRLPPCIFCGLKNLRVLNISHNNLNELEIHGGLLYQLQELHAEHCSLEKISIKVDDSAGDSGHELFFKRLHTVNLAFNELPYVDPRLVYALTDAASLDVTGNPLQVDSCVQYPLFQLCSSSSNAEGGSGSSVTGADALAGFTLANVSSCPWLMCPEGCVCSEMDRSVVCSGIGLTAVPEVGPSDTEVLVLDHNRIHSLQGLGNGMWPSLRQLIVDYNMLTTLSVSGPSVPRLSQLWAAGNDISGISWRDCGLLASVKQLIISANRMVELDFASCGYLNIVELDASQNFIKRLDGEQLSSLPHIRFLNMSGNSLRSFTNDMLDKAPVLELLDLSNNHLKETRTGQQRLSPYHSRQHRTLRHVYLNNNELEDLSAVLLLVLNERVQVELQHNPWECSCGSIRALQHMGSLKRVSDAQCNRTGALVHRVLQDVDRVCLRSLDEGSSDHGYNNSWATAGHAEESDNWLNAFFVLGVMGFLAALVLVLGLLYCAYSLLNRVLEDCCCRGHPSEQSISQVYICHDCNDDPIVVDYIVPRIETARPSLNLLYCRNTEVRGYFYHATVNEYLNSCDKVLVVINRASNLRNNANWFKETVELCHQHTVTRPQHFQMLILLLEDRSPAGAQEHEDRSLAHLFSGNRHPVIYHSDSDHMKKILRFLEPRPPVSRWPQVYYPRPDCCCLGGAEGPAVRRETITVQETVNTSSTGSTRRVYVSQTRNESTAGRGAPYPQATGLAATCPEMRPRRATFPSRGHYNSRREHTLWSSEV